MHDDKNTEDAAESASRDDSSEHPNAVEPCWGEFVLGQARWVLPNLPGIVPAPTE